MADHDSHFVHGSMDISQHKRGYAAFLLAFFRTHNGLPPT